MLKKHCGASLGLLDGFHSGMGGLRSFFGKEACREEWIGLQKREGNLSDLIPLVSKFNCYCN